jgi:hypothetical protein
VLLFCAHRTGWSGKEGQLGLDAVGDLSILVAEGVGLDGLTLEGLLSAVGWMPLAGCSSREPGGGC